MSRRARWLSMALVAMVIAVGVIARTWKGTSPAASCTATLDQQHFSFTPEQAANAATIAAAGRRVGMPAHAVTVALATAMQESGLINLAGGDRDSAGLFQQRPSQGWGSYAQVTNPVTAATTFYTRLSQVSGWQTAAVTVAAQRVQLSAAPLAYAHWEAPARALAVALTGEQAATFTCSHLPTDSAAQDLAMTAQRELGSTRLAATYRYQPGWAVASWLVAHASGCGITHISFDGSAWSAKTGRWTGTPSSTPGSSSLSYST